MNSYLLYYLVTASTLSLLLAFILCVGAAPIINERLQELVKKRQAEPPPAKSPPKMQTVTPEQRRVSAHHESGHATIALILMPDLVDHVFIRDKIPVEMPEDPGEGEESLLIGGGMAPKKLNMGEQTQTIARNAIVMLYGGLHGERAICNEHSAGVREDLRRAAIGASDYIDFFGLPDKEPIFYDAFVNAIRINHAEREREIWEAIERRLTEASQEARAILQQQDVLFRAIAEGLIAKGRLSREELLTLRERHMVKASS